MTRIHQQASSRQHERWHQFGIRCEQGARRAIWVFAVLAFLASLATAQSTSQLNGSVTDPSGASVAGAKITLTDAATGLQRTTTSNAGRALPVPGCASGQLSAGGNGNRFCALCGVEGHARCQNALHLNIQFQVAGVATSVTVEGQAPLINRTDASLGNTVEENQIAELPIADRNVVQLLSLQPGVAYLGNSTRIRTPTRAAAQ